MTVSCGYFKAQGDSGLTAYHLDLAFTVLGRHRHRLGTAGVAVLVVRARPPRPSGGGTPCRRIGGRVVGRRGAVDRDRFGRIVRRADIAGVVADRGREVPALVVEAVM